MGLHGEGEAWIRAVSFHNWSVVLDGAVLSEEVRMVFRKEIIAFLMHCKSKRSPATIGLAKSYIEGAEEKLGRRDEGRRGALRWFFRAARGQPAVVSRTGSDAGMAVSPKQVVRDARRSERATGTESLSLGVAGESKCRTETEASVRAVVISGAGGMVAASGDLRDGASRLHRGRVITDGARPSWRRRIWVGRIGSGI